MLRLGLLAISLTALLPVTASYAQTVSFSPATDFAVGSFPVSVAIGDLNGDGKPDLAVANVFSNNISILLGTGAGAFGAATNFAVGGNPRSVAIGDLNGDGKPDLAVANSASNTVSILVGTGAGAFGAATTFAAGSGPFSVAIGDLNGDGKPDLAVASNGSNTISILLGTGTGAFSAATTFAAGSGQGSVAIGDLNGDGKPDLAVADRNSHNVSILLNSTVFSPSGSFSLATCFGGGESVAIGDLNGDGKPDLALANTDSNNVSILLGTGSGSFGSATEFAAGLQPISIGIGDLNGDGKLDLAVGNYGNQSVSILLGTGTGAFGSPTGFAVGGSGPYGVTIGDLNGDGKPDLAVGSYAEGNPEYDAGLFILLGTGSGAFGGGASLTAGTNDPYTVAIGDLNGDGKPDLAVGQFSAGSDDTFGTVSILLGDGTGAFGSATEFAAGLNPVFIAIGDLNGDGKPDLAVANLFSNSVSILLGDGTGAFGSPTDFATGYARSVAIGDLNGDGKPDLAVTGNNVSIRLGDGTGSFGAATNLVTGAGDLAIGDLNGDGKLDLVTNGCALLNTTTVSDTDAPLIQCDAPDGQWHADDVGISCTAEDSGSGLVDESDASFNLWTAVPANTETANALTDSREVCDVAGNCATAGPIGGNMVDKRAPVVSCGSADGQWHPADVSIGCTAGDGGSGLAYPADSAFNLSTSVATNTETLNASTDSRAICDAVGNCSTAGPIGGNMVDRKVPTITIVSPATLAYVLNQAVASDYACSDGGSGLASCAGPVADGSNIDTASVGSKSFTVNAADSVANMSSETVNYTVSFNICLLYDPTRAVRSPAPMPIKIQLCDASGSNVSSAGVTVTAVSLVQISSNASEDIQTVGNSNPDNNFRFDSTLGGYIFNLSTRGLTTGTYNLGFTAAGDPATHVVSFQVR